MTGYRIVDLPDGAWKKYALEAERRGKEINNTIEPVAVVLLGALDMIRELTERVEELERKYQQD